MSFPGLERYLEHLYSTTGAYTRVWLDADGHAQGRYFNSTLTSAFQAVRQIDTAEIIGYEGFARSYSKNEPGLCIWKLLDQAANDDESVELDRLCRMLHAMNFFRQSPAAGSDLYLSVHARLLTAVDGNHGTAFRRILEMLDLPQERIVLQLPPVTDQQRWLLHHVADNYRRNDFRVAINAIDASDALMLIDRIKPDAIKVDARQGVQEDTTFALLDRCAQRNIRVIFKRVENTEIRDVLADVATASGHTVYAQGFAWGQPSVALASDLPHASPLPLQGSVTAHTGTA